MSEDFKIPYQDLTDININNLIVERNALIQENKQLKEQKKQLREYIKIEVQENKQFKEKIKRRDDFIKYQQQKTDKAIKYIKNHKEERKIFEPYGTPTGKPNRVEINIKGYYDLLEILEDEERE